MARLIASDGGVRGVDVTTPRGTYKYNPDRKGVINVDNPKNFYNFSNTTFIKAATLDLENRIYSLDFELEENAHSAYKK